MKTCEFEFWSYNRKSGRQSYFFLITMGNPLSTSWSASLPYLPGYYPSEQSQVQMQTIKGKNTHYRPVQLLHQDGVDPPGGGGVRISSIVSFSLGVNGAPLTKSRAMMWTLVFCLCFLYAQNPPATPATRSCPKPHIIRMDLRRKLLLQNDGTFRLFNWPVKATRLQSAYQILEHKVLSPQNHPRAFWRYLCQFSQPESHHGSTTSQILSACQFWMVSDSKDN